MNIGVICELNPLHNGHAAIFDFAKNLGEGGNSVVAVMSGNYCQRGEPALIDKWARSKMAILAGADIVLEIPSVFSQQSAQFFADASIDIICKSGICDAIVFGSECGDIDLLKKLAHKRNDDSFQDSFKSLIASGLSYPRALSSFYGCDLGPNDILGVEYLTALEKRGSGIGAFSMKRIGGTSHGNAAAPEKGAKITSAAAIRNLVCATRKTDKTDYGFLNDLMPSSCAKLLQELLSEGVFVPSLDAYSTLIIGKIREMGVDGVKALPFSSGGLAECVYDASCSTSSIGEIIGIATGKSYTSSRIRRTLLSVLTGAKKEMFEKGEVDAPYVRVLAAASGRDDLLSSLSKSQTPVIFGNIPKNYKSLFPDKAAYHLFLEILASDFYVLGMINKSVPAGRELSAPLIKI